MRDAATLLGEPCAFARVLKCPPPQQPGAAARPGTCVRDLISTHPGLDSPSTYSSFQAEVARACMGCCLGAGAAACSRSAGAARACACVFVDLLGRPTGLWISLCVHLHLVCADLRLWRVGREADGLQAPGTHGLVHGRDPAHGRTARRRPRLGLGTRHPRPIGRGHSHVQSHGRSRIGLYVT